MDGVVPHELRWRSDRKVVCGKANQFTFEFVVGSEGFPSNAELQIYSAYTWSWTLIYWHFQSVRVEGASGIQMESKIFDLDVGDWKPTHPPIISIKNRSRGLLQGESIFIHFKGLPPGQCCQDTFLFEFRKTHNISFSSEIGDVSLCRKNRKKMSKQMLRTIQYIPNNPYQLKATAIPISKDKGNWDVSISVQDGFGNHITDYSGECNLSQRPSEGWKKIRFKPETSGTHKIKNYNYVSEDPLYISVESKDKKIRSISTHAIGNFDDEWNVYFGDIHGHTTFSDGIKPAEYYYKFARDISHISVCAATDHYPNYGREIIEKIVDINDAFYEPYRFVTLHGFEWDCKKYKHHKNIYFPDRSSAERLAPDTPRYTEALFRYYKDQNVVIVPHHPNVSSGLSFAWKQHNWGFHDGNLQRSVEIYQMRGNSETEASENEWGDWNFGASVRYALNQGYKLGFLGGTDTHQSEPASACLGHPMYLKREEFYKEGDYQNFFGMSGFLAKELTREAIYEAMKSRRTYATTGDRILLVFYVNDKVMGTEIETSHPPRIKTKVWGTDDILQLDIIKDGKIAYQLKNIPKIYNVEWEDKNYLPQKEGSYYYVRIRQHNRQMAWASPKISELLVDHQFPSIEKPRAARATSDNTSA